MKSTLKRELKGREIVRMEGYGLSTGAAVLPGGRSEGEACGDIIPRVEPAG